MWPFAGAFCWFGHRILKVETESARGRDWFRVAQVAMVGVERGQGSRAHPFLGAVLQASQLLGPQRDCQPRDP